MITTVSPDGALRSRPMFTPEIKADGELWFFTSDETVLAHDAGATLTSLDSSRPSRSEDNKRR